MGVPLSNGSLRVKLRDMQIGDYIVANYVAGTSAVGTFSNLGGTAGTEIPVASTATPNGSFYFIKADKGLLIADRNIQISLTWDVMSNGKVIQGLPWDSGNVIPTMTSNTAPSGVASASSSYGTNYDAWKAFDRVDQGDGWVTAGNGTGWLCYDFGSPKVINKYSNFTYMGCYEQWESHSRTPLGLRQHYSCYD